MADNIAETMPTRTQHIKAPTRTAEYLQHGVESKLGRCAEAVADILVALTEDLQVEG